MSTKRGLSSFEKISQKRRSLDTGTFEYWGLSWGICIIHYGSAPHWGYYRLGGLMGLPICWHVDPILIRLRSHRSILNGIRFTLYSLPQTTFKWCSVEGAESGVWRRANRSAYSEYSIQYTPMWSQPYRLRACKHYIVETKHNSQT